MITHLRALLEGLEVPNPEWLLTLPPEALTALGKAIAGQAKRAAKNGDMTREAIESALPAMRDYARKNPIHHFGEVPQDPNGVHAWLEKYAPVTETFHQPTETNEQRKW